MVPLNELELANQKNRLFTFGCSFTSYHWPTWADILGREFKYFENWGRSGGGNQFIFNSLIECIVRNKLTTDDTVIIMWTNVTREDRWAHGKWMVPGNIYTQGVYPEDFVKKFVDPIGCLIRDLATITAAKKILELSKINHIFLSMVPITNIDQYYVNSFNDINHISDLYEETINYIKPSIFETVFDFDWWKNKNPNDDGHPNSLEHLEYIEKILPEFVISQQTRNWVLEMVNINNFETCLPKIRF